MDRFFRYIIILLVVLIQFKASAQSRIFCTDNPFECAKVAVFYNKNFQLMHQVISDEFKLDPAFLYSMVAPEIARFNAATDFAESMAVEAFYCQLGKAYANYSIGYFQMKPSFIEELEKTSAYVNSSYNIPFSGQTEIEIRTERIKRLKSCKWQCAYLCIFCNYLDEQFSQLKFSSKTDKLKFYATAYNRGLQASVDEIEKWMKKEHFTVSAFGKKYNYASIAVEIFNKNYTP